MDGTMYVVLEAHARCATLYLQGALSHAVVERAVTLCVALPDAVRDLRIDASGVDATHEWSAAALGAIAVAWRATGSRADEPRGVVTISLHVRASPETGSRELPRVLETVRAAPIGAASPP